MNTAIWVLVTVLTNGGVTISQPMTEKACESIKATAIEIGPKSKWADANTPQTTLRLKCHKLDV